MSPDGDSDGATDTKFSVQVIPYMYQLTVTVTKTKLVEAVSCDKPGLTDWPKPSDSRRSKQIMAGIKNNNINVFAIVLFWWYHAYLFIKLFFQCHVWLVQAN